jgi:flagellar hook-basal body complex protein FliE
MTQNDIQNINAISPSNQTAKTDAPAQKEEGASFGDLLKETLGEMNTIQKEGQEAMSDIATGQVKDLHQAAMAINKAELNMKMMLEVRNKALNAYKEILRTQV